MLDARNPAGQPFTYAGGNTGVLLLHGFTATCAQMRPLGESLRDAGYTVVAPLLPGHGTTLEDMNQATWKQWLDCAREAYVTMQAQVDRIVVCGLSMGGTLAALLAEQYMPDAYIGIAAAINLRQKFASLAGVVWPFVPYIQWKNDNRRGENFMHSLDVCYGGLPVRKMVDLNRLRRMARRDLALITCPTLVIQPVKDETVDPSSANVIMSGIQAQRKKLVMLEHSPHVCTLGPERERINQEVLAFLKMI